ncbi:MAG TPA: universal stress protein [Candidatus Binatia bacterium]|nr:universal stress protein [Candidatus Binatia bacterium]
MTLLIALDDSAYAETTLAWVLAHPWPAQTRARVLSVAPVDVIDFDALGGNAGSDLARRLQQERVRAHEAIVEGAAPKLRAAGLDVVTKVRVGDPRDAIVREVEEEPVDLVVVGSHGRTGLARMLLGSVAGYVVAHAPANVAVIKRRA